jgi:hypothetical protein
MAQDDGQATQALPLSIVIVAQMQEPTDKIKLLGQVGGLH